MMFSAENRSLCIDAWNNLMCLNLFIAWPVLRREVKSARTREVSSVTFSPAGIRFRATVEVVRFVVFRPEPDYVHWRQFSYC